MLQYNTANVLCCRHTLETNLKIEREWRSGMQTDLEKEKERTRIMEKEILQVSLLKEVCLVRGFKDPQLIVVDKILMLL